mmetsp:Transcript_72412/g.141918  ORF Transcript_72412/g.141918 Transcript_72412/m.141918 type:complete len:663 (+) Transcript_72412:526-2514(+)
MSSLFSLFFSLCLRVCHRLRHCFKLEGEFCNGCLQCRHVDRVSLLELLQLGFEFFGLRKLLCLHCVDHFCFLRCNQCLVLSLRCHLCCFRRVIFFNLGGEEVGEFLCCRESFLQLQALVREKRFDRNGKFFLKTGDLRNRWCQHCPASCNLRSSRLFFRDVVAQGGLFLSFGTGSSLFSRNVLHQLLLPPLGLELDLCLLLLQLRCAGLELTVQVGLVFRRPELAHVRFFLLRSRLPLAERVLHRRHPLRHPAPVRKLRELLVGGVKLALEVLDLSLQVEHLLLLRLALVHFLHALRFERPRFSHAHLEAVQVPENARGLEGTQEGDRVGGGGVCFLKALAGSVSVHLANHSPDRLVDENLGVPEETRHGGVSYVFDELQLAQEHGHAFKLLARESSLDRLLVVRPNAPHFHLAGCSQSRTPHFPWPLHLGQREQGLAQASAVGKLRRGRWVERIEEDEVFSKALNHLAGIFSQLSGGFSHQLDRIPSLCVCRGLADYDLDGALVDSETARAAEVGEKLAEGGPCAPPPRGFKAVKVDEHHKASGRSLGEGGHQVDAVPELDGTHARVVKSRRVQDGEASERRDVDEDREEGVGGGAVASGYYRWRVGVQAHFDDGSPRRVRGNHRAPTQGVDGGALARACVANKHQQFLPLSNARRLYSDR